jgi:hypothetical protein
MQMERCVVCGKVKPEKNGWWWTEEYLKSIGAKILIDSPKIWERRIFACRRCTNALEKPLTLWSRMMQVKKEYDAEKAAKEKEEKEKLETDFNSVLNCLSGWVKVGDIRDNINKLSGHETTSKSVAALLRKRGLIVKRRTHGVFYVYVK